MGKRAFFCVFATALVACQGTMLYGDEAELRRTIIKTINARFVRANGGGVKFDTLSTCSLDSLCDLLGDGARLMRRGDLHGRESGIGARVLRFHDSVLLHVDIGSPAAVAGVSRHDILLAVDGEPVSGMRDKDIEYRLRGRNNTSVVLGVASGGVEREVIVVRKAFTTRPIAASLLNARIGYLRLNYLGDNGRQVIAAIDSLETEGCRHYVLDLRNCPGGSLPSAVALAQSLLERDAEIATVQGKPREPLQRYRAEGRMRFERPLYLIVDDRTAAGAEMVAKSLQENGRATVVGQPTRGRGSVQMVVPMNDTLLLKLTTGYIYLPKSGPLEGNGVRPDIVIADEVMDTTAVVSTAVELKQAMDGADQCLSTIYRMIKQ
ncbi:MAG: S41 family peptidase [Candidatus Edwardsbacteria bacterium]|jgi:C-terminal peptidase prc|nr:S41 family peptidase [Candidatus Edwardsbacteria bacterium]